MENVLSFVLYYVVLNALLLATCFISFKIVKCTIGKDIKDQFKKQFHRVFWFSVLSYVIGTIPLYFCGIFDLQSLTRGIEILIVPILYVMALIYIGPNTIQASSNAPNFNSGFVMLFLSIMAIITFFVSLAINYFRVFRELDLKKSKRFLASLIVSAMTAPYFYLVSFYGLF